MLSYLIISKNTNVKVSVFLIYSCYNKIYEIIDSPIPLKKRDLLELNKKLESLQQEYETRIQKEDPNLVSEDITNRMKDLVENKNGKHI